jgi:WD40 repeat protein
VTFSPDGTLLATAAEGGEIRLWDTASLEQAAPAFTPDLSHDIPYGRFGQLVFTPDGRALLAKAPGMAAVLAWDVPSQCRHVPLHLQAKTDKRTGFVTMFSSDGRLVAATNPIDVLHLWDTATGQRCAPLMRQHQFGVASLQYSISAAAISPDGCFVALYGETRDTRYEDIRLLHLWDIADPRGPRRHLLEKIDGIARSASRIRFSADSRMLASTIDGRLRVWDTASRLAADLGDPGDDARLRFSPDSRLLAEAGRFRLRLWDTAALAVAASGPRIRNVAAAIEDIDFSPDGRLIATAEGTTARVWHVPAL